jgi:mevalonate kinase
VRDKLDNPALRQKTKQTLQSMGEVTRKFVSAFKNCNRRQLHQLVIKNEELLEQLGVVSARTQSLIRQLEKQGMAAKICGAGGVKENSGVVLVLTRDEKMTFSDGGLGNLETEAVTINQKGVSLGG